ncbi:MAG: hypothetical protein FRX49_11307 [Trebouxia sp. A1-2]|nr:MAG: hypothetical protein FRX49_11307 [Trebouxia sp. A1-2]
MYSKLEKIMYAKTWDKVRQLVTAFVQRHQESQPAAVKSPFRTSGSVKNGSVNGLEQQGAFNMPTITQQGAFKLQGAFNMPTITLMFPLRTRCVSLNGAFDEDVRHNACVRQEVSGDRGGDVLKKPFLQGSPLVVSGEDEPSSEWDSDCWPCCFLSFCFSFLALLAAALAAASSSSAMSCCKAVSAEASVLSTEPEPCAKDDKVDCKPCMAAAMHLVADFRTQDLQRCMTRTYQPHPCYLQDWAGGLCVLTSPDPD